MNTFNPYVLIYFFTKFRPYRDEAVQQYTEKEGSTTMVNIGRMEKIFAPWPQNRGLGLSNRNRNQNRIHPNQKIMVHVRTKLVLMIV